jgi:hypothetical protein
VTIKVFYVIDLDILAITFLLNGFMLSVLYPYMALLRQLPHRGDA